MKYEIRAAASIRIKHILINFKTAALVRDNTVTQEEKRLIIPSTCLMRLLMFDRSKQKIKDGPTGSLKGIELDIPLL